MFLRPAAVAFCFLVAACAEPAAEWLETAPMEPTLFAPGVISTEEREYGITFTPDGREAYFTRRSRRGPSRIMVTRWEVGRWSRQMRIGMMTHR